MHILPKTKIIIFFEKSKFATEIEAKYFREHNVLEHASRRSIRVMFCPEERKTSLRALWRFFNEEKVYYSQCLNKTSLVENTFYFAVKRKWLFWMKIEIALSLQMKSK